MIQKKVGVIGAGAWGSGLAEALARAGHHVQVWAMEDDVVDGINRTHENKRYLPGYPLSENLTASHDIAEVASGKEFIILSSPSIYLEETARMLLNVDDIQKGNVTIGVITKGFIESPSGPRLILETLEDIFPACYKSSLVYISGPSHAEEVAMGKLTGLVATSENPKNSIRFRELMRVPGLMVYSSLDVVGVQICAAAKNVIAIVYGSLDAVSENSDMFGDNAESLLLAAGINEIQTLGFAMGATHAATFTSIAGVGDLDVTCRSKYGRNRRFGQDIIKTDMLNHFKNLDDLIARIDEVGYLAEGAIACKHVHEIAAKYNLHLTICDGLYRILNKEIKPTDFLQNILPQGSREI